MGFWVLYKICAIVQAKWVFLWLPKIIFSVLRAHKIYGKIIKSRKNHFKEPLLTIAKIWNIENVNMKIGLIWQCVISVIYPNIQTIAPACLVERHTLGRVFREVTHRGHLTNLDTFPQLEIFIIWQYVYCEATVNFLLDYFRLFTLFWGSKFPVLASCMCYFM